MAESIPTHEPEALTAGDTVKWTRRVVVLGEHRDPADSWVLTYYITNANDNKSVVATDNGDGSHLVTIPAATTSKWAPGLYTWMGFVAKAAERFGIGHGTVCVEPDFATIDRRDARSWAKRTLDAIEAVMENKATADQSSMSIGGTTLSRMSWAEMMEARDRLRREFLAEERADRISKGLGHPGRILVRL